MKHIVLALIALVELSQAQQSMYPLQVGNRWIYREYDFLTPDSLTFEIKITGDTVLSNGKKYFVQTLIDAISSIRNFIREDSQRVYIYYPQDTGECLWYQFNLQPGDQTCAREFEDKQLDIVLGRELQVYRFYDYSVPGFGEDVAEGLGVIEYDYDLGYRSVLIGAVINGVIYGTIEDAASAGSDTPRQFQLSQNFPNPFNSSTEIPFTITHQGWVTLSIHNLIGQQIALLVDELKTPGEYSVSWKADLVPTGVYFYRLHSGMDTKARSMIYIK